VFAGLFIMSEIQNSIITLLSRIMVRAVEDRVNPHSMRELQFELEFAFTDAFEDLERAEAMVVELWRETSGGDVPA